MSKKPKKSSPESQKKRLQSALENMGGPTAQDYIDALVGLLTAANNQVFQLTAELTAAKRTIATLRKTAEPDDDGG